MKVNPFRKFLTKEQILQEACVLYLRVQFPKLFFTHIPNEGRKTPFERWLYKIMGVRTGISDLLIFKRSKYQAAYLGMEAEILYCGLCIELKISPNKPTPDQIQAMKELEANGWFTKVVYSLDEFILTVNNYLKNS